MLLVKADSVKDYLDRYYKKDRMTTTLLDTYTEEFKKFGHVCTSHHDNVTGQFICWPKFPEWAKETEHSKNDLARILTGRFAL